MGLAFDAPCLLQVAQVHLDGIFLLLFFFSSPAKTGKETANRNTGRNTLALISDTPLVVEHPKLCRTAYLLAGLLAISWTNFRPGPSAVQEGTTVTIFVTPKMGNSE
jgi:hypothetical protein